MIINNISLQSFLITEDDFTTYYNNYIQLLDGNYKALFYFGGGIEIGLPLLNLLIANLLKLPYPYMLKSIYILLFIFFAISLTNQSAKYLKNKVGETHINKMFLLLCYLLFMKLSMLLTIERQAIASYFILLAVFTDSKKKYIWIFIGSLFHLTTPFVYLVVNKVIKINDYKLLFKYSVIVVIFSFFLINALNLIWTLFPNPKLGYLMMYIDSPGLIDNERRKVLKEILYFIPILTLSFFCLQKKMNIKMLPSVLFLIILMFSLSNLPGVPIRLCMPILFFMVGYYFYSIIKKYNVKFQILIVIFFSFLFSLQTFKAVGYYSRYPMISSSPAYYVKYFFESKSYINREALPRIEQITRTNDNKL
ncbi:EpsG family protein [Photobacterium phosphoreum]|nr:EpsG family protein [Photobacterium phosphoreum]OBU32393.1 hypothetical protein AYY24_19240 [Photobacterium phosphoreum]